MTLWKDLVHIPESVHKGDFVLDLSRGVTDPAATLRHYVVTDNLVGAYMQAMGLVDNALNQERSQAAFLHGSFGSGKSHFMAVLYLLLQGHDQARAIPKLAPVVTRYEHLTERRFLLVPFHMIGKHSMEEGVLGGYVEYVTTHHPDVPPPGVYASEAVFDNARVLRESVGDEAFFSKLNAGTSGGGGDGGAWGSFSAAWDAARFDAALDASPGTEEGRQLRAELVGDLVATWLPAMRDVARTGDSAWVGLDEGLALISQHAQRLGYDGVVFFLDELILWLASRAGDMAFLNREAPKVSKLVEAQSADRPVPIISFIARQRDLREFVGDGTLGAELKALSDALSWWEGRFGEIRLADTNLPEIVGRRLLRPVDAHAAHTIRASFDDTTRRLRSDELDVMLADEFDRTMFGHVFPFSPALVSALVALSSYLQRERTALRLLSTMLSQQRDELELGHLVPVGDLWEVVSRGEEPLNATMRGQFVAARRIFDERLRPAICEAHGTSVEDIDAWRRSDPAALDDDARRLLRIVRNDERIASTLVIAALAPNVDVLKGLTGRRIAALNFGAVHSPLRGQEASAVLGRLNRWSAEVTEIQIDNASPGDPSVSLKLSSFDLSEIIEYASSRDNRSNRIQLLRTFVFERIGVDAGDDLFTRFTVAWRGARRDVRVAFDNVRSTTDGQLAGEPERWTLVIDYPLDDEDHGPNEDQLRMRTWLERYEHGALTLAWLPSFLSQRGLQLVGRLLKVRHTLQRFDDAVRAVPPTDRPVIRAQLENWATTLEQQLEATLLRAYHLSSEPRDEIDSNHLAPRPVMSLAPGHEPSMPAAATFREGFERILMDALAFQFPSAPAVPDAPMTRGQLQKIADELTQAFESQTPSWEVHDRKLRTPIRDLVEPLHLGTMGESRLNTQAPVFDRLNRAAAGTERVTVAMLRSALDPDDDRTGLPDDLMDLVIVCWAARTNRSFRRGGLAVDGTLGLHADTDVVQEALPDEACWDALEDLASAVFGTPRPGVRISRTVARFDELIQERVAAWADAARALPAALEDCARRVGLTPEEVRAGARWQTAQSAVALLDAMSGTPGARLDAIARHAYLTSPQAVGASLKEANEVLLTLRSDMWHGLEAFVHGTSSARGADALSAARRWFVTDAYLDRVNTLKRAQTDALNALRDVHVTQPGSGPTAPAPAPASQQHTLSAADELDALLPELRRVLAAGGHVDVSWREGAE